MDPKKIAVMSGDRSMFERIRARLARKEYYEIIWICDYNRIYELVGEDSVDFVFYEVDKALQDGVNRLDALKDLNPRVPVVVSALLDIPDTMKRGRPEKQKIIQTESQ